MVWNTGANGTDYGVFCSPGEAEEGAIFLCSFWRVRFVCAALRFGHSSSSCPGGSIAS